MALKFLEWLVNKTASSTAKAGVYREIPCSELFSAAADYTLRQLSFDICVDMIANAIGRCEFRTYRDGAEIREREYWTWNFEPNPNQNSTVFLHKLVDHLYRRNETLVISVTRRDGTDALAVADAWEQDEQQVLRENEYRHVRVEDLEFNKTFQERDVLRLRLNQTDIRPVVDALTDSWSHMAHLAMRHYQWDRGQHWKAHVNELAAGDDKFTANFAKMIQNQIKPFFDSDNAVLPEFDGYEYTMVGGESGRNAGDSRDLRELAEDIFDFTARGFLIPSVLVNGKVEATADANHRFLTYVIDPLCDQLQEEITRKRYGYEGWAAGNFLRVDSSSILHYDLFGQAASVEKLIGSGVYSINDILRAAGQATIDEPWADEHFMTLNIERLEDMAKALGKGGTE